MTTPFTFAALFFGVQSLVTAEFDVIADEVRMIEVTQIAHEDSKYAAFDSAFMTASDVKKWRRAMIEIENKLFDQIKPDVLARIAEKFDSELLARV